MDINPEEEFKKIELILQKLVFKANENCSFQFAKMTNEFLNTQYSTFKQQILNRIKQQEKGK